MCASLPTRRLTANSRSSSPSPGSRLHRRARRFPKHLIESRESQSNVHPAVPFDALNQFFGPFAPSRSSLADFYNSFCDVDQFSGENDEAEEKDLDDDDDDDGSGDGDGDGSGERVDRKQNAALSSSSVICSNPQLDQEMEQPALLPNENRPHCSLQSKTTSTNFDVRRNCSDSHDSTLEEVRGEMAMLCRLVQSELRESRSAQEMRYSLLQDAVNEAVRLAESLEGRLDAMRVPQRRQEPRPSLLLALTLMDAVASVILFVISFCIARPIMLARQFVARARGITHDTTDRPVSENLQRISRSWRLSNRELDESFLVDTMAKRISFSAATRLE